MSKPGQTHQFAPSPPDEATRWQRWRLEYELLDGLLHQVEATARAILTALRCPIDPVGVYDILTGARPAPWPARTTARAKQRAKHAMYTLLLIQDIRHDASPPDENAPRAAFAALRVGLLAGDAPLRAVSAAHALPGQKKGGTVRGQQLAAQAKRRDRDVHAHARRWDMSDELQWQFPNKTAYIIAKTGWSRSSINRRLRTSS